MRILFTVAHFYRAKANAGHGSERADSAHRVNALTNCLAALHQNFGIGQGFIGRPPGPCNQDLSGSVEVVVCTAGEDHLLGQTPGHLFEHRRTSAEPRLLGYECHAVLAERIEEFDYFCFLEDDILISDPLLFWKLRWFSEQVGGDSVLQPHRFELSLEPPIRKLYIDGPLVDPTISPRFQDRSVRPRLEGRVFGRSVHFERVDNPHAGCFFLTREQMRRWVEQEYFLDRAQGFWGPLESAATLGVMRTFRLYKPAPANAGFFEVRHLDNRYLRPAGR